MEKDLHKLLFVFTNMCPSVWSTSILSFHDLIFHTKAQIIKQEANGKESEPQKQKL